MCPYAKYSILISLEDAMYDYLLTFYIVNSPTKRVCLAVVFTRRVLDLKFVLSKEFRLPYLSTVKNFSSYKG